MFDRADRPSTRQNRYDDIQVELTQMVFHNILTTMVLGAFAVIGTSFLLAHLYHDRRLWSFSAIVTAISVVRLSVIIVFNRRPRAALTIRAARRWIALYSALTIITFTAIAAFTIYNFRHHDATGQVLLAVGTFILCAGLSGRLSAWPRADQLAGVIIMGGIFCGVAQSGERYAWVVCLMLVMFVYGHCFAIQNRFDLTVEQLRSRRMLRALADHDALTGLANRRQFEASLARLCGQTVSFAVLFLDLDGFKKVNDTLGHATGDLLLEHVAQRLQGVVRDSDLIARLGGDEFAILHAPGATRTTASALALRILETVSTPYQIDGHAVMVGTSIGIQLSLSEGNNDPHRLLSSADKALYLVKQGGKGSFRFAGEAEALGNTFEGNGPGLLRVASGRA